MSKKIEKEITKKEEEYIDPGDEFPVTCEHPLDHEKFLKYFNTFVKFGSFDKVSHMRRIIMKQTMDCIMKNRFVLKDKSEKKLFTDKFEIKRQVNKVKMYIDVEIKPKKLFESVVKVEVLNKDCLEVGIDLVKEKLNPIVLNMTATNNPGGGFRAGSGAQEETLFRRTTLYNVFFDPYKLVKFRKWKYPMKDNGGCYAPEALVFRESEKNGYKFIYPPIAMSFISIAARKAPRTYDLDKKHFKEFENVKILGDKMMNNKSQKTMYTKIETMLMIAQENGHHSLVLSAFGCGAYRCPSFHVAYLFRKALKKFKYSFKKVIFAIIEDHNSRGVGNFKPFEQVFSIEL